MTFNEDREQTYTCVYTPASEGEYRVSIRFAGREIPKSPFRVKVQDQPGDASKVVAAGPGLQSREVFVGRRTHFEVNTKGPLAAAASRTNHSLACLLVFTCSLCTCVHFAGAGKGILDVTIVAPGAELGALANQLNAIPIKAHLTKRSEDVTIVEVRFRSIPPAAPTCSLIIPVHSTSILVCAVHSASRGAAPDSGALRWPEHP